LSRQQKIEELTERLSKLKEQRNIIDAEAGEFAEKRNVLNARVKSLRMEILAIKKERDKLNTEVKEQKQKRSETKEKIRGVVEEARKFDEEISQTAEKIPSRSFEALQREVEEIDWKIQTMSPSKDEEKELVERVKELETQLNVHRRLQQLSLKLQSKRTEIRTLRKDSENYHEKLTEEAKKSQLLHKRMLAKIEESKKLKDESDRLHKQFLEARGRAQPVQEAIARILEETRLLKEEIRAEENMEKKQKQAVFREKVENEAREKLKRGEKLTWEEFQLLEENNDENDKTAQD